MYLLRKRFPIHYVLGVTFLLCVPVLSQDVTCESTILEYDKNVEASGLRGVWLDTQPVRIPLPSRSIEGEKLEAEATVYGPYRFSSTDGEWGPNAHYLGIQGDDNAWISSCQNGIYHYICSKQGENAVSVFKSINAVDWEYITLVYGDEINYPDINTGSGYIYISCAFSSEKHPAIVRSKQMHNLSEWENLIYWGGTTDVRTTSVGSPLAKAVCFGFHVYSEPDILYFHTMNYPDDFMVTTAYNPYASVQRDVEMDGTYDYYSGNYYIYTAHSFYDPALLEYQGRVVVYELDATALTLVMSEKVAWSDTSSTENLTLHGREKKFTIAYQYYLSGTHNIYARTYDAFGSQKASMGHVAEDSASDMYPRVFHDEYTDYKYFSYLKLAGAGDVYSSVADWDNNWIVSEQRVLDSATSRHTKRGVCTAFSGMGVQRQLVAWIDERNSSDNIYYNLELLKNEACPGEEINISAWTPGSGASITIDASMEDATDDIDEYADISCWLAGGVREQVYRFTPPEDMSLQIDLTGSNFDTKMAIVSPCPVGENTCMFNDDYEGDTSGFDCTEFQGGTSYSIIITAETIVGEIKLNITECTDVSCTALGCTISMPHNDFGPGDSCCCDVTVCNPGTETYTDVPVFAILDVYGSLFFAPGFSDFDHYTETILPGETVIPVLPNFSWPSGAGSAAGIFWYAAMTNQEMTALFGDYDAFQFGWHP